LKYRKRLNLEGKQLKSIFLATLTFLYVMASTTAHAQNHGGKKILIAYFSHGGNTRVVAEILQKEIGGDIFEIKTVQTYPKEFNPLIDMAKREQEANARPSLSTQVEDMSAYDTIFLGYPNWWGTMPMALFSFLEQYDFAGKTVIPFCTHNGSRLGSSVRDIERLCPEATILDGLALNGGRSGSFELGSNAARTKVQDEIILWLRKLGMSN
jgi:flavodoxin